MKRLFALSFCLAFVFLSACGSGSQDDPASTSAVETTQTGETVTRKDVLSANDTYGNRTETDGFSVADDSICYRTQDSYRLEPIAIRAAQDRIRDKLARPDSLQIKDCNIWNCADCEDIAYYSLHFSVSYLVESDERIDRGYFFSIGVRKADETAFDATDNMEQALAAYSIFSQAERDSVWTFGEGESDIYSSAAKQIAASRLKNAESGKVLSAKQRLRESDKTSSVWDVMCEGENDFGMCIPDVYTVYIRYENGTIVEVDPAGSYDDF